MSYLSIICTKTNLRDQKLSLTRNRTTVLILKALGLIHSVTVFCRTQPRIEIVLQLFYSCFLLIVYDFFDSLSWWFVSKDKMKIHPFLKCIFWSIMLALCVWVTRRTGHIAYSQSIAYEFELCSLSVCLIWRLRNEHSFQFSSTKEHFADCHFLLAG